MTLLLQRVVDRKDMWFHRQMSLPKMADPLVNITIRGGEMHLRKEPVISIVLLRVDLGIICALQLNSHNVELLSVCVQLEDSNGGVERSWVIVWSIVLWGRFSLVRVHLELFYRIIANEKETFLVN